MIATAPSDEERADRLIAQARGLRKRLQESTMEMLAPPHKSSGGDGGPRTARTERLHTKLSPGAILHLASKAKRTGILNGYQRRALYNIGKRRLRGWPLGPKQEEFLDNILKAAMSAGIADADCQDDPCDKCEEVFRLARDLSSATE